MNHTSEFAQRFELGPKLAESSTSSLYRAYDKSLAQRSVAIKLFSNTLSATTEASKQQARFIDEAERLRLVSHNTLVPLLGGGYENGRFYLAMELIEGPSLQHYFDRQTAAVDAISAVEIIEQLSGGIKEIHEHGLFHGSLDAQAILFKHEHPRIAGYAPQVMFELEKTQGLAYTERLNLQYLAPEQVSRLNRPDSRCDIYALAVILYRLLTNRFPFELSGLALLEAKSSREPEPPRRYNPELPALIDASIVKALSRERNNRFNSLSEFIEALRGGRRSPKNPLLEALGTNQEQNQTTATAPLGLSTQAIKQILSLTDKETKLRDFLQSPTNPPKPIEDTHSLDTIANIIADTQTSTQGMLTALPFPKPPPSTGPIIASLLSIAGPQTGRQIPLTRSQLIIGSDPTCDIVIEGSQVPEHLALLAEKDGDYYLSPIGGKALKVNKSRIKLDSEKKLKDRDILRFHPHVFRFYRHTAAITRPAPAHRTSLDKQALFAMLAILLIVIYTVLNN